jgi:hypothetical protein
MKIEVASNNSSQSYTCYSENRTEQNRINQEKQESEGASHPERNESSLLNYQSHLCDSVSIKVEKRRPLIDKIGL